MTRGYDPDKALAEAVASPPLAGAKRHKLLTLDQLAKKIRSDSTVVISDVHADLSRLTETLRRLCLIDEHDQRMPETGRLVQIGDLVDGRNELDRTTLEYGATVFDLLLAGNHEAALIGGKPFNGMFPHPDIRREIEKLVIGEKMLGACVVGDVLISHAGANSNLYADEDPAKLAQQINDDWQLFYARNGHQPDRLFAHTPHRGRGGFAKHGGVLWQDFSQLIMSDQHSDRYRQLTGHSVLGGVESDPDDRVFCIDTAGPRLGVAVLDDGGHIEFGSDVVPPDQAA
jgi:hypothetical protein